MIRHFLLLPVFVLPAWNVQAATFGMPVFTTAPTAISVVNNFYALLPSDSFQLTMSPTVIATAHGAPELAGQTISMTYSHLDDFGAQSLVIGGTEIVMAPDLEPFTFLVGPPYEEETLGTFTYTGIFQGFGPRTQTFPEFLMRFTLDQPIPMLTGYLYCNESGSFCDFSNTPGLTEIGGEPVNVRETFTYPEGHLSGVRVTFETEGGARPPAPVPLPATAWLLAAGVGALTLRRARRDPSRGGLSAL